MYKRQDIIMEKLAPIMRKYANIIKNHYGLDEMTYADLKLAIDPEYEPQVSIEEARDYIVDGLSPLGEEYIGYMKKAFEDRWIDYSQNIGTVSYTHLIVPFLIPKSTGPNLKLPKDLLRFFIFIASVISILQYIN